MTTCKCPTCGASVNVELTATATAKRKRRSRFEASNRQYFGSTVAAPAMQTQPSQAVDVAPGTSRDVKHIQPETPIDVATFALKALGYGIAASCVSIMPTVWWDLLPWYTPIAMIPTAAGVAWFFVSGQAQGLVTFTENLTRLDLNGDGKVGDSPLPYRAKGEIKIGQTTIYTDIPVSDHAQWHAFCKVVAKDEKKFSQTTADKFNIDLPPVLAEWVTSLLADPATVGMQGKRPELTAAGRGMVRLFANTPPPGAGTT